MRVKWEGMLFGEDTIWINADIQEDRTMKQMTANALPMHIHNEMNGFDNTKYSDCYLTNIGKLKEQRPIGRRSRIRQACLEQCRSEMDARQSYPASWTTIWLMWANKLKLGTIQPCISTSATEYQSNSRR